MKNVSLKPWAIGNLLDKDHGGEDIKLKGNCPTYLCTGLVVFLLMDCVKVCTLFNHFHCSLHSHG